MAARSGNITGFAMACSNTFGLVTGAFLLGFGLSEIPKGIWLNSDWNTEQKVLSHKVAKMAVKLDDAHHDFSNAIVITQATSKQMSKRDSLRPYMNIIDKMLLQILKEDPSFKPQGGTLGESGMDYDTDDKSMAALRRRLTKAREQYYRYRRYTLICLLEKSLAVILGCMSFAILLAEATIQEVLVQKMGKINDAVPFFGKGFNKIYPLIMVIYTSLIASNIFNRVIKYCGNWKIFKFSDEAEDMDGFDLSGVIILRRECSLLQQGHKVGELVFPLARSFSVSTDVESTSKAMERVSSSLTSDVNDSPNTSAAPSSVLASKWESMMHGFKILRSNIDSKGFLPLSNAQGSTLNSKSSSESLDDIFERLKRPPSEI
ncbi:hypothetical protein JHK87_035189 [Glycine soja]|nr:hypothetical protein JHK87_035189 [Glycine soja]